MGNQLVIECPVARIVLGKPPIARWSVTAESEVPSTGSGRRAGGRDLVLREGAVAAVGGYLLRSSLCTHSCNRACQIVLADPLGEHLR